VLSKTAVDIPIHSAEGASESVESVIAREHSTKCFPIYLYSPDVTICPSRQLFGPAILYIFAHFGAKNIISHPFPISIAESTKVLRPLFDEIEMLITGDSPSIFPSPDKM